MFTTSCFRERLYRKHLVKKFRINVNMANFIVNKCPYPMPFFFSTPAVILKGSWENSAKLKKNNKNVSEFIYMGKKHYNWLVKIQILREIGVQVSSFDTDMKPQKNIAFWTGFFRAVGRKNRRLHGSQEHPTRI